MTTLRPPMKAARQMRWRLKRREARRVRKLWTTIPIVPVNIGVNASGTVIMYRLNKL